MKRILTLSLLLILSTFALKSQGLIQTRVALTGNVFNQVTKQPETAAVLVFKDGKRVTATRSMSAENGYYYLTGLKPGETYEIQTKKRGFMKQSFNLEVPKTDKYTELSKDILIMPKREGVKIPLAVPPFEYNKSKLRVGSDIFLEQLAETMELNPDVKFEIVSYPDNNNNAQSNAQLTQERAKSLEKYFTEQGIEKNRISLQGNKKVDPDNPPPTEKASKGKRYIGKTYLKIKSL